MASEANKAYCKAEHNYTMLQAFEWYVEGGGKHWKKLTAEVPRLSRMGITAMWVPPPTKASGGESVGYDIYDLYDLGEFDRNGKARTHYGTKEELLETVRTGKRHGILTYIDAVLNHKFGADRLERFKARQVAWDDRNKDLTDWIDIEGWTGFDFPSRNGKYSTFKWNYNHFSGVDYNEDGDKKAIYRIWGEGKTWPQRVDREKGNYAFLMGADVDHAHPEVSNDLYNWGAWIMNELDAGGFRFDAIKHFDSSFMSSFVNEVRNRSNKPKMFCVGEFWKDSFDDLSRYLDALGTQFSVFDTPLHYNFKEAGDRGSAFDLRSIWDGSIVQKRPIDAVTLVDNHDTQIGQSLESWVPMWFKPLAYAMILLRIEGYPCVFWGDLYGCGGDNPQAPMAQLEDFIKARKWFSYGEVWDYWNHANCVAWVRTGNGNFDGCAVVCCNGDQPGTKWMGVGKEHAGETWIDVLGWRQGKVIINQDGWAEFSCHARSASIWAYEHAKGIKEFSGRN